MLTGDLERKMQLFFPLQIYCMIPSKYRQDCLKRDCVLLAVIRIKCSANISVTNNCELFLLALHFCMLISQVCLRSDRTLYTFASDETAGGTASAVGIPCLWSVSC